MVSEVMITLLVFGMLALLIHVKPAASTEDNWWNPNWTYRRQVNITENSGYSLIDFPIEASFRHDGHVQAEGRDIRVIENNTEIPYCITKLNSTHITVMFEIHITSLSIKNLYVYYGNPNASTPNYPLVPLTIFEGQKGNATIDNLVYIGWDYTSWGWSNNVELWNDFRIDFNVNNDLTDDDDLIRDYGSRQGGIGRHRADIQAIGLGEYQSFFQTPIYVDIMFANASLRVYKNQRFVETTQADSLHMFSPSYTHGNCGVGTEQNLVDGEGINNPEGFATTVCNSKENPGWMAFRDTSSGQVFASAGMRIGSNYSYHQGGKEAADWDRAINYNNRTRYELVEPYDQPPDCRIFWYGDNSNNYSKIEIISQILNNQPSILVGSEETTYFLLYWLSLDTFKNNVSIVSNMTVLDENTTIIETAHNVFSSNWLLPYGTYYVQASIFHNEFVYTSEQIQVNLTDNTKLAINFLFGNVTLSCLDIKNIPLENCTVVFTRQNEKRIKHTDGLGLTTLEAYYGNWTVEVYWLGVLVGEANIHVNQSRIDMSLQCNVGDLTVVVVDQYGRSVEANITLTNDVYDLTFLGYIRKPLENMTFTQIPLIDYNLTIKDDFGTQTYSVNTEQTRQIQIETLPLPQKLVYIILGTVAGIIIGSLGVCTITKRKRKNTVK